MEKGDSPPPDDRAEPGLSPSTGSDGEMIDDRTQAVASAGPPPPDTREAQDRRLAQELSRRGVPPDEIERLLALGREDTPAHTPGAGKPASTPVVGSVAVEEPYEPHPTITLPEPRESTAQEQEEAGRILMQANVARRRGQFGEAARLCSQALEKTPGDAPALEMYGDVMQALGRVDDALYCYDRARQMNPGRASAERKFAELRLMQNRELEALRTEDVPRNPYIAIVLSLVFPGGGQVYNGQPLKGLIIAVAALALVLVLGWTDYGFHRGQTELSMRTVVLLAVAGALYIYAVIDANLGSRGRKPRSGWDV